MSTPGNDAVAQGSRWMVALLSSVAMLAFAGNSLLCRLALKGGSMDAASFTSVRLLSGALVLALIVRLRHGDMAPTLPHCEWVAAPRGGEPGLGRPGAGLVAPTLPHCEWVAAPRRGALLLGAALRRNFSRHGDWPSALALFVYAAGFSFAYLQLSAATGALLLFGAVQVTMIAYGLWRGERLRALQWLGLLGACGGLVVMLLPGLAAPPLLGSLLMVCAGVAWGAYSLFGRGKGDATAVTAGNFWRAAVLGLLLSALTLGSAHAQPLGVALAVASGALASGLGYSIWYTAIRSLSPSTAASVQLTVPALAALGAVALLGEALTLRLALASLVILGGVALVIWGKARPVR
jgi:drug/metabolite transporter (DMT)-like permease